MSKKTDKFDELVIKDTVLETDDYTLLVIDHDDFSYCVINNTHQVVEWFGPNLPSAIRTLIELQDALNKVMVEFKNSKISSNHLSVIQ